VVVQLLLEHKADVGSVKRRRGETALHFAAMREHEAGSAVAARTQEH
jgi:hypothetical protein